MVLENYVTFDEGVPKLLHFTDSSIADRDIADPVAGITKKITVLLLQVDREDAINVAKMLSVTSENLASQLHAYLVDRKFVNYDFRITRRGAGFSTRYTVEILPHQL